MLPASGTLLLMVSIASFIGLAVLFVPDIYYRVFPADTQPVATYQAQRDQNQRPKKFSWLARGRQIVLVNAAGFGIEFGEFFEKCIVFHFIRVIILIYATKKTPLFYFMSANGMYWHLSRKHSA